MKWHLTMVVSACALVGADARDAANKKDVEKWKGTWQVVSLENDGKTAASDQVAKMKLTVKGTDYHFQNGDLSEHGSYRFNAATDPKQLDIVVGDGPDKGKVYLVIYEVADDRLSICLESANKKRPTALAAPTGSGCVLEVWKRVKP